MPLKIESGRLESWEIIDRQHLQKALEYGLLPTESLTGQVISKLGEYRRTVLKRKYYQGVKSKREAQKLLILDYAQNAIKALQAMEQQINCPQQGENKQPSSQTAQSESQDNEKNGTLTSAIETFKLELSTRISQNKNLETDKITDFVRNETLRILQNAKALNQFITYDTGDFAMTRGKLDEYCEDALKIARDYQFDLHKKIQKEHQGIFDISRTESISIGEDRFEIDDGTGATGILPLEHLNGNREAVEETVMAIVEIENPGNSLEAHETAIPQWSSNLPLWQRILNQGIAFFNIIGLIFLNTEIKCYHTNIQSPVWREIEKIQMEHKNIIDTICEYGKALGNATVIDLFRGVFLLFAYPLLIASWHLSALFGSNKTQPENQESAKDYLKKLLGEDKPVAQQTISNRAEEQAETEVEQETPTTQKILLELPYHLSSFESNDPLSFAVKTATQILGHITHHMYEQNSFLGVVFSVTGAVGGLSILAPQVLHTIFQTSLVAKPFIATGNALGGMDVSMQAMAAIMMPAKGAAIGVDFLSNGWGSFLGSFTERLGNNPNDLVLFVLIALSFGWMIPMVETGMTLDQTAAMMPVPMPGAFITNGLVGLIHSQKSNKNTIKLDFPKENQNKTSIVFKIIQNQEQLARKSYFERRILYQKIRNDHADDSLLRDFAYKTLLMPKASGIFTSTAVILLNHFIFPKEQLMVDLAIILNALALVTHAVTNLVRAVVCAFADAFWNNIIMRGYGKFNHGGEFSSIHKISPKVATAVDSAKISADSKLGFFANFARREATRNTPATYAASLYQP